ncbi:MAG: hypothetical protein AAF704_18415 [Cyanobacteria bacterium P01_D01_bin.123]
MKLPALRLRPVGAISLCVLGASACTTDVSSPTATSLNQAAVNSRQDASEVSLVFRAEETTATVTDAALTLALASLPADAATLANLADAANRLLGQAEAIALSELERQPTASCVDLVAPNGVGLEDVATILAIPSEASSVTEFGTSLQALLPEGSFQVESVPTVANLEQCPLVSDPTPSPSPDPTASPSPTASPTPTAFPTASPSPTESPSPTPTAVPSPNPTTTPIPAPDIPDVSDLSLTQAPFFPGGDLTLMTTARSADGFAASNGFQLVIGTVISLEFPPIQQEIEILNLTLTPEEVDPTCIPARTQECSLSISVPLPEDAPAGNYTATLTAINPDNESGSASAAFEIQ